MLHETSVPFKRLVPDDLEEGQVLVDDIGRYFDGNACVDVANGVDDTVGHCQRVPGVAHYGRLSFEFVLQRSLQNADDLLAVAVVPDGRPTPE